MIVAGKSFQPYLSKCVSIYAFLSCASCSLVTPPPHTLKLFTIISRLLILHSGDNCALSAHVLLPPLAPDDHLLWRQLQITDCRQGRWHRSRPNHHLRIREGYTAAACDGTCSSQSWPRTTPVSLSNPHCRHCHALGGELGIQHHGSKQSPLWPQQLFSKPIAG